VTQIRSGIQSEGRCRPRDGCAEDNKSAHLIKRRFGPQNTCELSTRNAVRRLDVRTIESAHPTFLKHKKYPPALAVTCSPPPTSTLCHSERSEESPYLHLPLFVRCLSSCRDPLLPLPLPVLLHTTQTARVPHPYALFADGWDVQAQLTTPLSLSVFSSQLVAQS
jgi:hypothetical protein